MIIDTHTHVFLKEMPLVPNPRHAPGYSFSVEQLMDTFDAHGVDRGVIAAASPWGDYNDYVIDSLRKHPRRLRGTIIALPSIERMVLDGMAKDGIVGVRLPFISMKELPDLDTWDWRKFLRRIQDLDWHVHLHLDGPRLPLVLPQLERSGVKIVIDHIGRPDPVLGVDSEGFKAMVRSVEKGRTWVKLSGAYRLGPQALGQAQALCRLVGYDKMLWASDCPFVGGENDVTYAATLAWLDEVIADKAARSAVLGSNALKFYFGE
jgi:predicted TIM-barrel fold metal-dependent hydrolase